MIKHILFTWNACVLWRIQFNSISIPFMVSESLGSNIGVRSHNVYLDEMLASSTFHPQWWDNLSRPGREADKTKCSIESKVKITTRVFSILWPTKHKKTRNSLLYSFIHWMATYLNRVDSQVGHSSLEIPRPTSSSSCAIEADGAFRYLVLPHPSPEKTDDCTHFVCEVVIIFLCNWSTWSALNKILTCHMSFTARV